MISDGRKQRDTAADGAGIAVGEVVPLATFRRRMGLSVSAWRALRRAGFPYVEFGKRTWIVGGAAVAWFQRLGDASRGMHDVNNNMPQP